MGRTKKLNRPHGLGGTDAIRLVDGKWKELWDEKTGKTKREDLSDILPVQLGIFTEKFNKQWYQKITGERVVSIDTIHHPEYNHLYGNLDGVCKGKVFEAKHTNAFAKDDTVIEKYYPQLQHYMMVTGFKKAILSVIFGNMKYKKWEIDKDEAFIQKLMKAETLFWYHVTNDIVPPDYMDFNTMEGINDFKDIIETFGIEISDESGLQGTFH